MQLLCVSSEQEELYLAADSPGSWGLAGIWDLCLGLAGIWDLNVGSVLVAPTAAQGEWGSHRVTHSEITKELPC